MKPGKTWWLLKKIAIDSLETIQNSLNYWSRKEGLPVWSIIEMINFLFKWHSISLHIIFKTTWKSYFKNNEKNNWKFTLKNWENHGNIMEFFSVWKRGNPDRFLPRNISCKFSCLASRIVSAWRLKVHKLFLKLHAAHSAYLGPNNLESALICFSLK